MDTPDSLAPRESSPAPADPLVGSLLVDRYRIRRKLGEGGMGVVYEGEHELIGRRVAIKCLHAHFARRTDVVTRFQREALAASRAGNEHIVEATDMGTLPDGGVFLVLEYLEGRDFSEVLEHEGPLPVSRTARIAGQLCEALSAAHAAGIVHRDLKPENVFLIRRGDNADFVKLLDFGIARFQDEAGGSLTRTGVAIGTPNYMSPEQIDGLRDLDHRADVYSLGVMLYSALTGEMPYEAPSFAALVVKIARAPVPDPRKLRPGLPAPLAEVVMRCMAKDRADRPADCAEVRAVLSEYTDHEEGAPFVRSGDVEVSTAPTIAEEAPTSETRVVRAAIDEAAGSTSGVTSGEASGETTGERRVSNRALFAAMASVAVFAGASAFGVSRMTNARAGDQRALEAASASARASVEASANAVTATASPSAAPSAVTSAERTVHIRLRTLPPRAQVLLDGLPIANPFDGELPYSTELHRLEVRAPGYQDVIQDLALHLPQSVEIPLENGRGVQDRRTPRGTAPRATATATASAARPSEPARVERPSAAAASAQATAAPAVRPPPTAQPTARTNDLGGVAPTVPVQEI